MIFMLILLKKKKNIHRKYEYLICRARLTWNLMIIIYISQVFILLLLPQFYESHPLN